MSDYDYSIYYSRWHDDTESHANSNADWLKSWLGPLVGAATSEPCLDIGCGYGFALLALKKLGFSELSGIDISVQQAKRAQKLGFPVTVTNNTTEFLNTLDKKYSVILLMDVLEHVEKSAQIELLRAIRRVLLPNGRLVLTVPNANSILAARWFHGDYTHTSSFTECSLEFVLKNAGFSNLWLENEKGIGKMPKRLWRKDQRAAFKKWLIRYCWLQVYLTEMPWEERIDQISFELNLKAVAYNA